MEVEPQNLNNNQENHNGWGGKREGAGRPKGSTNKPRFLDYVTPSEVEGLMAQLKAQANEKPDLLKFALEQIFGKPRQNVGLDGGEDGKPIEVSNLKELSDEQLSSIISAGASGISEQGVS